MAVKGKQAGSRVRHLVGADLGELEDTIELLPYKVDVIAINRVGAKWYVHFYIPELAFAEPERIEEIAKKTETRKP